MKISHIRNFFVYLFVIGFFFYPNSQAISGLLAFVLTLFIPEERSNLKKNLNHPVTITMGVFFVFHLTGLIHTENMNAGLQAVQNKISFLLFPLFFFTIFSSINLKTVLKTLFISSLLYVALCFIRGGYFYLTQHTIANFFSSDLFFELVPGQIILHPTYGAVYFTIITTICCYLFITKQHLFKKKNNLKIITIVGFSVAYIIFSGSKLGFLSFIISSGFIIVFYALHTKRYKQTIIAVILLASGGFIAVYSSPLKLKFEQAYLEMFNGNKNPEDYYMSTGARLWTWKTTIELIEKHPISGVGTGDIKDELNLIYDEKNMVYVKGLDSHQQYLQTFASIGVFGFLSLTTMLITLLYLAIKNKNFLLLVFTFTYIFWGFTESMFERHEGILFFISIALLLIQLPKQLKNQTANG